MVQVDTGEDVAGETTSVPDVMTTALEVAEVEGTAVIGTTMITVAAAAAGRDIAITIAVDVAPLAVAVAVLDIAGEAAEGESHAGCCRDEKDLLNFYAEDYVFALSAHSRSPGYDREHRISRDEYRPSSRGGRDSYDDRDRGIERAERGVERGYGRSEY